MSTDSGTPLGGYAINRNDGLHPADSNMPSLLVSGDTLHVSNGWWNDMVPLIM
jgi:hypothetical protein